MEVEIMSDRPIIQPTKRMTDEHEGSGESFTSNRTVRPDANKWLKDKSNIKHETYLYFFLFSSSSFNFSPRKLVQANL